MTSNHDISSNFISDHDWGTGALAVAFLLRFWWWQRCDFIRRWWHRRPLRPLQIPRRHGATIPHPHSRAQSHFTPKLLLLKESSWKCMEMLRYFAPCLLDVQPHETWNPRLTTSLKLSWKSLGLEMQVFGRPYLFQCLMIIDMMIW